MPGTNLVSDRYYDQASFRFEGIPYANPPERFTYSTMYSGSPTINATAYGPECIQSGVPEPYGSEDCLYLNIYTPYIPQDGTESTEGLKPVMFWIHGGAFTSGAGSQSDGGNMASRGDVVIVTINYRLSTLGFLALEEGAGADARTRVGLRDAGARAGGTGREGEAWPQEGCSGGAADESGEH